MSVRLSLSACIAKAICLPSGEKENDEYSTVLFTRVVVVPVLRSIESISSTFWRAWSKIVLPLGEKDGESFKASVAVVLVARLTTLLHRLIVYTSPRASRWLLKTTNRPSGDHCGP